MKDSEAQDPKQLFLPAHKYLNLLEELMDKGRTVSIEASGFSMSPIIKDGDQLTISRSEKIRLGDVVLIKLRKRVLIHRVIKVKNNRYTIKGDNRLYKDIDGEFPPDQIIGKVTLIRRKGKPVKLGRGWTGKPIALLSRIGFFTFIKRIIK